MLASDPGASPVPAYPPLLGLHGDDPKPFPGGSLELLPPGQPCFLGLREHLLIFSHMTEDPGSLREGLLLRCVQSFPPPSSLCPSAPPSPLGLSLLHCRPGERRAKPSSHLLISYLPPGPLGSGTGNALTVGTGGCQSCCVSFPEHPLNLLLLPH